MTESYDDEIGRLLGEIAELRILLAQQVVEQGRITTEVAHLNSVMRSVQDLLVEAIYSSKLEMGEEMACQPTT